MSGYYLVCFEHKVKLWWGGSTYVYPESAWSFLFTDHAGHSVGLISDDDVRHETMSELEATGPEYRDFRAAEDAAEKRAMAKRCEADYKKGVEDALQRIKAIKNKLGTRWLDDEQLATIERALKAGAK